MKLSSFIGGSLLLMATTSAAPETYVQSIQPFWKALARECPAKHLENLSPGILNMIIEEYLNSLSDRTIASAVQGAQPMCTQSVAGVSCANIAYIRAFNRFGEIRRVAHAACRSGFVCRGRFDCTRVQTSTPKHGMLIYTGPGITCAKMEEAFRSLRAKPYPCHDSKSEPRTSAPEN